MMIPDSAADIRARGVAAPSEGLSPSINLLNYIEGLLASLGGESCRTVELRRRGDSPVDVRLFFRGRDWISSPSGEEFRRILAADPAIADVRPKGVTVSIRCADRFIDDLGARLESGDISTLDTSQALAGKRYAVGFAGPNTSKALHIGHLRNITIGNALAATLGAAGADVLRQSLVGDIGRNICEAMAGLREFHPNGIPEDVKPDHAIGNCYARYVREYSRASAGDAACDDPAARETRVTDDPADEYMRRWLARDPDVHDLWCQTRDRVLEGHQRTLRRFGVLLDRHDYESDAMDDLPALVEHGVCTGILRRENDGTVLYDSGRPEFEQMVLIRNDGFPTEHARLLGVYYRLFEEWGAGRSYIDIAGTEWQPASALHTELLQRLRPELMFDTHILLFHGMVTLGNAKMSSSEGGALLIDHLLDRIDGTPAIQELAESATGAVSVEELTAIVVRSFFLCRPHIKPMEFSWDLLMGEDNPGWTIARAWCAVMGPEEEGPFDASAYRLAVIRSQDFYRNMTGAASTLSLAGLASYLLHFCEDFLAQPADRRLRRLARTVLCHAMPSLGLITPERYPS